MGVREYQKIEQMAEREEQMRLDGDMDGLRRSASIPISVLPSYSGAVSGVDGAAKRSPWTARLAGLPSNARVVEPTGSFFRGSSFMDDANRSRRTLIA